MPRSLKIPAALKKRAAQITVVLMDVDGTMTDGGVTLLSQTDGTALEIKTFDAHDGQGLTLAQTAGLRTGCITGRDGHDRKRCDEVRCEVFIIEARDMQLRGRDHGRCTTVHVIADPADRVLGGRPFTKYRMDMPIHKTRHHGAVTRIEYGVSFGVCRRVEFDDALALD